MNLYTASAAVLAAWAICSSIDYEVQHAEDRERVGKICRHLGRTIAEDSAGRFTCADVAPSWAMTHVQIAEQMRGMK